MTDTVPGRDSGDLDGTPNLRIHQRLKSAPKSAQNEAAKVIGAKRACKFLVVDR
jgi:propanediol utilization protein